MATELNRREMLRMTAAAGLAVGMGSAVSGQEKAKPIRLGVIGTGSRGTGLLGLALSEGIEVPALCDIDAGNLEHAIKVVAKVRNGVRPVGYSDGPKAYQQMLQRDDLDAVLIATPIPLHATMAVDAMRAGKDVLSEVTAATTVEDCWNIIRATEETGRFYMLAENCCYSENTLMIQNMINQGLFGVPSFAECGYLHDCRTLLFKDDKGTLTWRGELARECSGNWYPTHAIGPVAQWFGVNRGDRMVSLAAASTGSGALREFVNKKFPEGHPARQIEFKASDTVAVLIKTAKGGLIDLRYDTTSPRPSPTTTYYGLQATKGAYRSETDSIYVEGRSKPHEWESGASYAKEFEHPLWTRFQEKAATSGHGGIDFFVVHEFLEAWRQGRPSPIDCYDAATWSVITPLSVKSLAEGGKPQEFPDFTQGKWESQKS